MTRKTSDSQLRASAKYKAEKTKKVLLEFYSTDMDLYDHLQTVGAKQTYIKSLIRKDIEQKSSDLKGKLIDGRVMYDADEVNKILGR